MLQNIFLKTVRDYIRQILIWGGGLGLIMLGYGATYNSVFVNVPNRAKAIEDYQKAVESMSILTGKVYGVGTYGGFIDVKIGSMMPVLLGLWTLIAATGVIRGEEERGSMDLLLSTPHTRASVLLQKWAGVVVSLLAIMILSGIGLQLGAIISNAQLDLTGNVTAHLNWMLQGLIFGALALLFCQFTTRRAAAGWGGGIMAATYLLNNLVQSIDTFQWTKYLFPFYYGSLSHPLAPEVGTNWGGIVVLVVIIIPLVMLALWMYQQRDLSGYFEIIKRNKPVVSSGIRQMPKPTSPWLANNFTFGLRAALPGVLIWGLSISAYMLLILSVFNDIKGSMLDLLSSVNVFSQIGFVNLTSNENLLSLFIFLFLVLLVAAYAVVLVASWTAEENEGRLELVLSNPEPRWRLLLTYFGVAVVASALMVGLTGAIFGLCTWAFNVPVNAGNAFGAFLGLWVVTVIIEAIGYILAAFGPGWAVSVTAGIVILSYLSDVLKDVLKLPESVTNLSIFKEYGRPLAEGLRWTPQFVMLALSVLFIAIAIVRFRQRDITK
ncbi:MAG TPA: ABC transporter permease subunit [Chloroflexia bacterium]|nr:ABC transporter permease subunit [Chloroflexia bacterium]